ncbi:E3 ubiquitin-protein ligase UHRF1-like, partial [Tetranychus urticae]|uniref:E3 ubiquitin-protein ligase UHRF1-like n=1 Tax=Tetranychus urticae TaxID=32264 RepID=UPI000D657535
ISKLIHLFSFNFLPQKLRDEFSLLDYGIKINEIIHFCIQRLEVPVETEHYHEKNELQDRSCDTLKDINESKKTNKSIESSLTPVDKDDYYLIGDHVDCLHPEIGAWFEGKVCGLYQLNSSNQTLYEIKFWKSSLPETVKVTINGIRPQSYQQIRLYDLNPGDLILANSNLTNPGQIGYWYDFLVTSVNIKRKIVQGTLFIGDKVTLDKHSITGNSIFYAVQDNQPIVQRNSKQAKLIANGSERKRPTVAECTQCSDDPETPCVECSCCQCGSKADPEKQIVCDECNNIFHLCCLPQPLERLPPEDEDWYCHNCKNTDAIDIEMKEEASRLAKGLKRKRKASTKSSNNVIDVNGGLLTSTVPEKLINNWGRGISCVGRTKVSEVVPKNHFGPIPGIPVGTIWRFRFQASEAGVHTPLVAGIHGKQSVGAFSIVFCCGYDDDIDLGDEIYFTGSGGKDSSTTKCRVGGPQIKDQELTRCNKALAINCAAPFSNEGASSGTNWRLGKPVRVLRSGNARGSTKKSPYLPKIGVRYDGTYKVVKYWPERKDNGLLIWRFLLRRDDTAPSPWTKEGKRQSRKLGLSLIEPPGFIETFPKRSSKKRKVDHIDQNDLIVKRLKVTPYKLPSNVVDLIQQDKQNSHLWKEIIKSTAEGEKVFLSRVEESFRCACCLEIVFKPVTTFCSHNMCKVTFFSELIISE